MLAMSVIIILAGLCVRATVRTWENDATRGYLGMLLYLGRQRSLRAALPCCSATSTGIISLMYIDNDGSYIKQDVPNMQVLECGCA